ncbi:hypothetical protein ACFQY5_08030 [Paeniroseomonas aquatica]|uniref:hypothetical protein n=1 Tax=Paeniroseomonas aquatica TaxID=373043 RepID=UPI003616F6F4
MCSAESPPKPMAWSSMTSPPRLSSLLPGGRDSSDRGLVAAPWAKPVAPGTQALVASDASNQRRDRPWGNAGILHQENHLMEEAARQDNSPAGIPGLPARELAEA